MNPKLERIVKNIAEKIWGENYTLNGLEIDLAETLTELEPDLAVAEAARDFVDRWREYGFEHYPPHVLVGDSMRNLRAAVEKAYGKHV